jgi:hypothetical protein
MFLATFGHAPPFADLLSAAQPLHDLPQDVAALMARLQSFERLTNALPPAAQDWPSGRDSTACDDPVIMPCCNALLRAYVQAEPPQLQRAAAVLSALIKCAHALPHALTSCTSLTLCRCDVNAARGQMFTQHKRQAKPCLNLCLLICPVLEGAEEHSKREHMSEPACALSLRRALMIHMVH